MSAHTHTTYTTGWLTKQSSWLKEWRRRYFILKGSKLFFAKVREGKGEGESGSGVWWGGC